MVQQETKTQVIINLAALAHNAELVRMHAPYSKILAVIKADAYGHGLLAIAEALSHVDGFAVARLEEAIKLRKAGIRKTILVLTGFTSPIDVDVFSQYELDAVVHSDYQVDYLNQSQLTQPITVWLKINTGMNRLGVSVNAVKRVHDSLELSAKVRLPIKLMTHLACADDMDSPATNKQLELFDQAVEGLVGEQSITNSAGLIGWKHAQRHWVRPGIMLYGGNPFIGGNDTAGIGLQAVMTLKSTVIALRIVEKGQSVGYGGTWTAKKTSLIATIGVGYGDGYPRHAAEGTPVLINQQKAGLVGRVSMDSINVDVSQLNTVKISDQVTLWGDGLAIEEIAENSETISYDLMCGVTQRVPRLYRKDADGK